MKEFLIIGFAQCLFFILFLRIQKVNLIANKLLIIWLFSIGFSLFLNYLYVTNYIKYTPHLIGLDTAFPFLYGPIIYLYTTFLTGQKNKFEKTHFLHFIPFLTYFIIVFFTFYIKNGTEKIAFLNQIHLGNFTLDLKIAIYLKFIHATVYLILTFFKLKVHRLKIVSNFSNLEKVNLNWLQIILYSLTAVYIIKCIFISLPFIGFKINIGQTEAFSDIAVVFFVWIIAYKGISQIQIFKNTQSIIDENILLQHIENIDGRVENKIIELKYQSSTLSESKRQEYFEIITSFMLKEKPYLDPILSISDFSEKIDLPSKVVSQIINEKSGMNFFNYINTYRVEEVKSRLNDNSFQHLTILGIALDCGFNSKSAFNNVFKKMTGFTPSEYMKK
jgi:AraC-like DNA-binding protein